MENRFLAQIFEAPAEEVGQLLGKGELSSLERTYGEALVAYQTGDAPHLQRVLQSVSGVPRDSVWNPVRWAVALRFEALQRNVQPITLQSAHEAYASADRHWRAELAYVLGLVYENSAKDDQAAEWFRVAMNAFGEFGAIRKALRSRKNQLAALQRWHHDQSFIAEYQSLFKQAHKAGENVLAGIALSHLAREYQKQGKLAAALKAADRALEYQPKEPEKPHWDLLQVQRAQLLYLMGHPDEAERCLVGTQNSKHEEVQNALRFLESLRTQHTQNEQAAPKAIRPLRPLRKRSQQKKAA